MIFVVKSSLVGYASRTVFKVICWIKSQKGTPCVPYDAASWQKAPVLGAAYGKNFCA